ncbi:polysaccharide deacetylase family protein [Chitinibacter sp. GC72]|uniref:polysaccharide deacetylase family protein n=1 Tax=Chitinibacter sp. GC72 TaxID=1526917 RepID=UPI0012F8B318|nr:polysaccharide deacetylase family protein [Chitinibacter sp. GC72]
MTLQRRFLGWLLIGSAIAAPALATPLAQCIGLSDRDTALIVNADDIGMHPDLDKAAFKLIDAGQIQDLSVMPPTPNFAQAAQWAKERNLSVGVHLTLTNEWQEKQPWGAVLSRDEVPSLYNPQGNLWATVTELAAHAKPAEVRKELLAQIAKVQATGLKITHLDTHMVFWPATPELLNLYASLPKETGIPIVIQSFRGTLKEQSQLHRQIQSENAIATPDTFSMQYNPTERSRGVAYQGYVELIKQLPSGVHTIGIHPAEDSPSAQAAITDLNLRLTDYAAWQDPVLHKAIKARGIKLITYAPLQALQEQLNQSSAKHCLK